ncbi:MAG: hypothetical protein O2955_13280 [Planctomycetota bacterium]|nr:hypothetical protein [Planctomycetota bacterium]MDA1213483.1 hypothetical protein [Planctomycetota bacterium]
MKIIHDSILDEYDESPASWLISLIFWSCLIAAGTLYGAVAIAPKLQKYLEVRHQFLANQMHLVQIEKETAYLKRVRDALENDPEFAAQMAQVDFQIGRTDAEMIPVDSELMRGARDFSSESSPTIAPIEPSYPFLQVLAESHFWRSFLITMSAGLTLTAFTFLHHPQFKQKRSKVKTPRQQSSHPKPHLGFFARYRLPDERQKVSDV